MSILSKIFPDSSGDTTIFGPNEHVDTSIAISAHQAMKGGMSGGGGITSDVPTYGTLGGVNIGKTIALSESYRANLLRHHGRDIRFTSTGDYAIDTGIKKGSKVIVKIVPESDNLDGSWDDRIRAQASGGTVVFPHFSVANINQTENARMQIHETFGADFIQSFGDRPVMISLSGYILNGNIEVRYGNEIRNMDWKNAFMRQYKNRFSLTNCVKNREKIRIFAEDTIWDGYLINLTSNVTSEMQSGAQVSFTMVLADEGYSSNMDQNIPGFVRSDGSGYIYDTLAREVSLEEYFQADYTSEVEREIGWLNTEIDRLKREIEMEANNSRPLASLEGIDTDSYFTSEGGVVMHQALKGSDIEDLVTSSDNQVRESASMVLEYNKKFHNSSNSLELEPLPGDASDDQVGEFKRISDFVALANGKSLISTFRVEFINSLCENYIKRINELRILS